MAEFDRFDRFFPIPGLLATSAVAFTLLGLKATNWRGSEGFADFAANDRTTVAIVVQIVSHLLGLIQIQVLCKLSSFGNAQNKSSRPSKGPQAQ